MIGTRVIAFLARPDARPTWVYERRVVLFVETLCLLAVAFAAPAGISTYLLLLRAPLQLRKAASDHAARSGAARRREHEEVMGRDPVKLTCARELEREAQNGQLVTATAPLVDLAFAWALAGGNGLAAAVIVSAACSIIRFGMVEGYGAWRRWYVQRRPHRTVVYRDFDSVFVVETTYADTEMVLRNFGKAIRSQGVTLRPKVYGRVMKPPTT